MAKVTSKYQVTVPKRIADEYSIHPGDEIDWVAAGEVIRVIPVRETRTSDTRELRLKLFDQATARHQKRPSTAKPASDKGWKREDLYVRGRPH